MRDEIWAFSLCCYGRCLFAIVLQSCVCALVYLRVRVQGSVCVCVCPDQTIQTSLLCALFVAEVCVCVCVCVRACGWVVGWLGGNNQHRKRLLDLTRCSCR